MTAPMHMDGVSVAAAIDARVAAALAGPLIAAEADNVPDSAETIDTSGAVTPANVAYTQADQTALADTVIALGASLDALQDTVNAILAALEAAGIMAAS